MFKYIFIAVIVLLVVNGAVNFSSNKDFFSIDISKQKTILIFDKLANKISLNF